MFDVHPPHSPIHGWRDFSVQLVTITVGLLIALALEGLVEWLHHRHIMHQAQASLYIEIKTNAASLPSVLDSLHAQQKALQRDVSFLKSVIAHPEVAVHESIDVGFSMKTFQNVSWNTAQATGALAFMPYDMAQEYSDIYAEQRDLETAELQAVRDTTMSLGPFLNVAENDPNPTREEAMLMKRQIEVLQGQLLLVDSYLQDMDRHYKNFLAQRVVK
jgi:hypothetical protein